MFRFPGFENEELKFFRAKWPFFSKKIFSKKEIKKFRAFWANFSFLASQKILEHQPFCLIKF